MTGRVDLRKAIARVQHRESRLLAELEEQDPVLTNHLLDELACVHHDLLHGGIPPLRLERSLRRLRQLSLVLILACRST